MWIMRLTVCSLPVQAAYEHLAIEKLAIYIPIGNEKPMRACVQQVHRAT